MRILMVLFPTMLGGSRMYRFRFMFVAAFLCASELASQTTPMDRTLTIYVDEGHGSLNGHVFVELSDGHNHNFYGFYPSEAQEDTFGKSVSLLGGGGEIRNDRTHHADVQITYHISKDRYDSAIRGIEAARKEGDHWWLSNHCGDFAEGVAKMAGVELNLPATWTGRDRPELFARYLLANGGERTQLAAPGDSLYLAEVAKDAAKVDTLEQDFWARQREITDPDTAAAISSVRESREAGWHYLRALIRYACADPDGFKANVSQNAPGVVFSYETISDFYSGESSNLSACDRKLMEPIVVSERPVTYSWLVKQAKSYRAKLDAEAARAERQRRREIEREQQRERESASREYSEASREVSSRSSDFHSSDGLAQSQLRGIEAGTMTFDGR
jgi:hypothetical protein